ncbi:MAG: shikimate kinase [Clostridia bacterium]|nr:shikimate kinase [Clostridia bacterium]
MKKYGLLGKKLGHSYSVPIHRGLGNMDYKLYEKQPEEIEAFIRDPNLGGINVTIPYKLEVMQYLDEIDSAAREIGAVNTVVRRDGRLIGFNTDHIGFCRMIEHGGIDVKGKKALVLGSGGASKTAVVCLHKLGASSVTVISREGENNYNNLHKHRDAQVIVNCTPVGMYPNNLCSPVDLTQFEACEGVADMIYNPLRTDLLMQAEKLGLKTAGGPLMLTSQGVRAHEYFFDTKVEANTDLKLAENLRRESENIVLIGMPGCGKSTVGAALARLSGREAVEVDALIAQKAGKTIPEIFEQDGEDAFRRLESDVLREESKEKAKIIMTGGGAVTRAENYPALHQNGRIYEIKRDIERLDREGRPLSKDLDTLKRMYEVRKPMYEAFRDVCVTNENTPEQTAEMIWRDFCENTCY